MANVISPFFFFFASVVSSPVHHHTHTYPGVAAGSPVLPTTVITPGAPVINAGGLIETPMVHHIHHLPGGKSRTRRERDVSDSEESDSDEGYPVPRRYDIVMYGFVMFSKW